MAGSHTFIMTEKTYRTLIKKGMDLRCKCSFNCNRIITIHDSVVSKPSKRAGRKYYLLEHYLAMQIDINNHILEEENGNGYKTEVTN